LEACPVQEARVIIQALSRTVNKYFLYIFFVSKVGL